MREAAFRGCRPAETLLLVVTGIFANTEDLKDGNGEMQVIELQVKE